MGITTALFAGVSGLDSQSNAISVIGDNIANVSTPGFKERRADFADVLGQSISTGGSSSQIGAGSKTARISPIFTQGTFETSARATDIAIEGRGFFVIDSQQGRFYSRAGLFQFNDSGQLVDPNGGRVQGFGIDPATGTSNGQLGDVLLDTAVAAPRVTAQIDMSVNLDSRDVVTSPFDPSNPNTSSNHRTVVTVYDSLGNPHQATVFYSKVSANTWDYTVTLPPASTGTAPASPTDQFVVMAAGGSGRLNFDSAGSLASTVPSPYARACFSSVSIGGLLGGIATGGRYPATSSMYSSARRLPVPGWPRIQPTTSLRSSVTKNIRSASPRWAIDRIETRGRPSGVHSSRSTESGSPSSQAPKPGAASSAFSPIASSARSFAG